MNFCVDEVVEDLPPCDHCVMSTQLYAIKLNPSYIFYKMSTTSELCICMHFVQLKIIQYGTFCLFVTN